MARDLFRVKEVLWEQFEKAVERQPRYEDCSSSGSSTPSNFASQGRIAIGTLGQAIIDVERELRKQEEREDAKNGIRLPGKP